MLCSGMMVNATEIFGAYEKVTNNGPANVVRDDEDFSMPR